ncbi:hypothetical protein Bca4012_076595 [Brassica carinata]
MCPFVQEIFHYHQYMCQIFSICENVPLIKMIKKQEEDWNEIEVRSISEILAAYEVSMFNPNSRNSSEGVSTPFSKRKEDDAELKDITSTSKKLCTKSIKLEKAKND